MLVSEPVRPREWWSVRIEPDEPSGRRWAVYHISVIAVVEGVWLTNGGLRYREVPRGLLRVDVVAQDVRTGAGDIPATACFYPMSDPELAIFEDNDGGMRLTARSPKLVLETGRPIVISGYSRAELRTPAINACVTVVAEILE